MTVHVQTELACVYRAAGRRYFSRQSAFRAAARALIKKHCDCEPAEQDAFGRYTFDGWACRYHDDTDHGARVADRLVRRIKRAYAKAGE